MSESQRKARLQLIVFTLNSIEFAVPIEQVWRVEPLAELRATRVPRAPDFLEGVVNVRGHVIPILDLKKRFALAQVERPPKSRLLVVEMGASRVGLIVDTVSNIIWFPTNRIVPPPPMVAQISGVFVQGIAQDENTLLIILDLQSILDPTEQADLEQFVPPAESAGENNPSSEGF